MKYQTILICLSAVAGLIALLKNQDPTRPVKTQLGSRVPTESTSAAMNTAISTNREPADSPPASTDIPPSLPPLPSSPATEDLNRLAEAAAPLEDRVRALAACARTTPSLAQACGVRMVGITPSAQYTKVLSPVLMDSTCPAALLDVLVLNLYDRPLDQRLYAWAAIVRQPSHPAKETAQEALQFHLGDSAKTTGAALDTAISNHLAGK